jgi:hypothetical protein
LRHTLSQGRADSYAMAHQFLAPVALSLAMSSTSDTVSSGVSKRPLFQACWNAAASYTAWVLATHLSANEAWAIRLAATLSRAALAI